MAVTIDRFEIMPSGDADAGQPAATEPAAGEKGGAGKPPPLSRHELAQALRFERARHTRVRAY